MIADIAVTVFKTSLTIIIIIISVAAFAALEKAK